MKTTIDGESLHPRYDEADALVLKILDLCRLGQDEAAKLEVLAFADVSATKPLIETRVPAWCWRIWPLTKLAGLLDEVNALRLMNQVRVKGLTVDERNGWVLRLSHEVMPILGAALAKTFESAGAKNYVEWEMRTNADEKGQPRASASIGLFTVTLQARFRPTPHELRVEAETREAALRRAIVSAVAGLEAEGTWEEHVHEAVRLLNEALDANPAPKQPAKPYGPYEAGYIKSPVDTPAD